MSCLLSHKWNMEKLFRFEAPVLHGKSDVYYRTCERCGAVQRGIYDILLGGIFWETLRKHDQSCWQEIRIVRQRSSRFEQLVHSLNLRRSRTSDRLKAQSEADIPGAR